MKVNRNAKGELGDELEDITTLTASPTPSEFSALEHDDLANASTQGCHSPKGKMKSQLNPHPTYFFEDGNLSIRVEKVDFKVHRYFFMRDSVPFRQMSKNGIIGRVVDNGMDDDLDEERISTPLVLENISSEDFAHFLSVLYPIHFGRDRSSTYSYWSSVLRVSDYLGFASIRSLSVKRLSTVAAPIEKIVIGRQFKVNYWLRDAYRDVCTRSKSLTKEEGRMLGVDEVVGIMEARQICLWEDPQLKHEEMDTMLDRLFGLQQASQPVPVPDDDQSAKSSQSASDEKESPSQPQLGEEHPASTPAAVNANSSPSSQEPVSVPPPSSKQESRKESPLPARSVSVDSDKSDSTSVPDVVLQTPQTQTQDTSEAQGDSPGPSLKQGSPADSGFDAIQSRLEKVLALRNKIANLDRYLLALTHQQNQPSWKLSIAERNRTALDIIHWKRLREEQLSQGIHDLFSDFEVLNEFPAEVDLSECGMTTSWLSLVVGALEQILYPCRMAVAGSLPIRLSMCHETSQHQRASLQRLFKPLKMKCYDRGENGLLIILPNAHI